MTFIIVLIFASLWCLLFIPYTLLVETSLMYNYFVAFALCELTPQSATYLYRAIALDLATSVYLWDE